MANFWGRVFGAPDAVSKAVDLVEKAGDALVYTDEEKAQAGLKRLQWVLEYMKATSGSNLARRLIAVMMVAVYLLLIVLIALFIMFGGKETADALQDLLVETLSDPISIIVGFYFFAGAVKYWKDK